MIKVTKDIMKIEKVKNIVRLLREGFEPKELIEQYDYDPEEVFLSVEILSLINVEKNRQLVLFN